MADKTTKSATILEYRLDEGSIRRTIKGVDNLSATLEDALDVLGDYAPITKAAMSSVSKDFADLDRRLDSHLATVDEITAEYERMARVEDSLADSAWIDMLRAETTAAEQAAAAYDDLAVSKQTVGSSSAGGGSALDIVDRAAGQGAQILSGLGAGGASGAVGLIGDAVGAVATFGAGAGVLTATVGVATLAINAYNTALEENRQRAETFAGAISEAFAAGTTAQIQSLIAQQEADIRIAEATRAQLEAASTDARDQLAIGLDNASAGIANWLNQLAGDPALADVSAELSVQAYASAIGESNTQITLAELKIQAYNAVLADQNIVAGDAADALAQAAAIRDRAVQAELTAAQEAESLTAEQRRQRVESLQAELDMITLAANAEGISADYKRQLAEQTDELNTRIRILAGDIYTAADAAAAASKAEDRLNTARQATSDLADELFAALQREGEAKEAARKATEEYTAARRQHEAAITQITNEANAKRAELEGEAADQRIKNAGQTERRIADIRRKADMSMANAIASRDALAYKQAQDAADEQIKQEKDALKERLDELDAGLKKQIDAQDKAMREAIAKERQRWDAERDTRQRAQQQLQIDVQNAQNAVLAIQRNANVANLALMELRATGEANIYQSMASTADFYLRYMENRAAQTWAAMAAAMATPGIGGGQGGALPTPFADGGLVTSSGLAMLHAPEIIMPLRPAGKAPLSNTTTIHQNAGGVTLNIKGNSPAQIRREVDQQLSMYFTRAGYYD